MKRFVLFFLLLLPLFSYGLKPECDAQGVQCFDSCCAQVGGTLVQGGGCSYSTPKRLQFAQCQKECRELALACETSYSSSCYLMFGTCTSNCEVSGTADVKACYDDCWYEARDCVESSGGSSCCGPALLLLSLGLGSVLFAGWKHG